MTWLILTIVAFISGAVPYSVIVGKLVLKDDIRNYGDHNPGATNVFRAGGKHWGVLAGFLDMSKAALPVLLAVWSFNITGFELIPIALAPILGHAYSPFLGFQGGKAVGATFGTWIGLTIWEIPTVLGLLLLYWFLSVKISGWAVMLAMSSLFIYLLLAKNDPILLLTWLGNTIIFALKHREDLSQSPGMNRWLPFLPKQAQAVN